jgi:hypothetical protein
MSVEVLYLFQCPGSSLFAIARNQTGCLMRRYVPDSTWLLLTEISRSEIPQDVLLSVNHFGYCLLDEYEIRSTHSRWIDGQRH